MSADTSSEAVEQLAVNLDAAGMRYGLPMERDCADAAATLRALAQERDALKAEVERLREACWQPIETAPRDGRLVLISYCDDHEMGAHVEMGRLCDDGDGLYWETYGGEEGHDPTSRLCPQWWMPKPPPKLECSDARIAMLAARDAALGEPQR